MAKNSDFPKWDLSLDEESPVHPDDVDAVEAPVEDEVEDTVEVEATDNDLVVLKKVRGPKLQRYEGNFENGKTYEVSPDVADVLLSLKSPHGPAYFERV